MPAFEFKGKSQVYAHHLTVPFRPLVPDPAKSVGDASPDGNLVIHGDNLHALKALLPRYAGQVKCVYIDPPYNTGNEGWVYNDNTNGPLLRSWYKAQTPVDGEDLERHDKWLTMMWPRLQLLKELLAEDGAIFVSIDDNEHHHLRMLMNDIFGENNFVATIVWHHRKSGQNDIDITLSHNYLEIYARNRSQFSLRTVQVDPKGFSNPDDDPRGPWVADPMDAPNVRENLTYEIVNPKTGTVYLPPKGRCWRFSREKYARAVDDNRILFGKRGTSRPQYKRFLSEALKRGVNVPTIWDDVGTATSATRELFKILGRDNRFDTPKPTELIKKIVRIAAGPNAIVLDSFAGSGTTGQAVLELNREDEGNRQFILVECEDYADTITAERVRRVIAGIPESKDAGLRDGLGGGFTYCELGRPVIVEELLTGKGLPSYASLASWLFHTATGVAVETGRLRPLDDDGLFYRDDHNDYYLLYEPNVEWLRSERAVLNEKRARSIRDARSDPRRRAVVFAPAKYMPLPDLTLEFRITFCQLPYEIRRLRDTEE